MEEGEKKPVPRGRVGESVKGLSREHSIYWPTSGGYNPISVGEYK